MQQPRHAARHQGSNDVPCGGRAAQTTRREEARRTTTAEAWQSSPGPSTVKVARHLLLPGRSKSLRPMPGPECAPGPPSPRPAGRAPPSGRRGQALTSEAYAIPPSTQADGRMKLPTPPDVARQTTETQADTRHGHRLGHHRRVVTKPWHITHQLGLR